MNLRKPHQNSLTTLKEACHAHSSGLIAELAKGLPPPKKVALVYDKRMLNHIPRDKREEAPARLTSIMDRLTNEKLIDRCDLFTCEKATRDDLLAVHNHMHIEALESIVSKSQEERDNMAAEHSPTDDLYYSEYSGEASFIAAGGAVKACSLVAEGSYRNSFAIVRPPGHHAGNNGPAGFCLLNNVAIGVKHLLQKYQMRKILIVDWDIHHGNGTQKIFYDEKRVLVFSVHRHDNQFYPNEILSTAGDHGHGDGAGYNINLCWENGKIRNVDYIVVWEHVLIPLIEEFEPEIIIISAGFDAGKDENLGGCCVTPGGFATLLHMLMPFAPIAMVLEGGYQLDSLSKSVAACIKVLLGDNCSHHEKKGLPYDTTWTTIIETRRVLRKFWKVFQDEIPVEISSRWKSYPVTVRKHD